MLPKLDCLPLELLEAVIDQLAGTNTRWDPWYPPRKKDFWVPVIHGLKNLRLVSKELNHKATSYFIRECLANVKVSVQHNGCQKAVDILDHESFNKGVKTLTIDASWMDDFYVTEDNFAQTIDAVIQKATNLESLVILEKLECAQFHYLTPSNWVYWQAIKDVFRAISRQRRKLKILEFKSRVPEYQYMMQLEYIYQEAMLPATIFHAATIDPSIFSQLEVLKLQRLTAGDIGVGLCHTTLHSTLSTMRPLTTLILSGDNLPQSSTLFLALSTALPNLTLLTSLTVAHTVIPVTTLTAIISSCPQTLKDLIFQFIRLPPLTPTTSS
jgi:hypothetical protein